MQALREQLAAVEGHLQDRDKKYRELNQAHKSLQGKHRDLEAEHERLKSEVADLFQDVDTNDSERIQPGHTQDHDKECRKLRAGNRSLQKKYKELQAEHERLQQGAAHDLLDTESADAVHPVRLPTNGEGDLAKKTAESLGLKERLRAVNADDDPSCDAAELHKRVTVAFNTIKDDVRALSLEHFNTPVDLSQASEQMVSTFHSLSGDLYTTYLGKTGLVCYMFRAFIWQWLVSRLFDKFTAGWPPHLIDSLHAFEKVILPRIPHHEGRRWHRSTMDMIYKVWPLETGVDSVGSEIFTNLEHFITVSDATGHSRGKEYVKAEIDRIVRQALVLDRLLSDSGYAIPGMAAGPNGNRSFFGFTPDSEHMSVKGKVGSGDKVTLVTTPSLVKVNDAGEAAVIVRAEVIC